MIALTGLLATATALVQTELTSATVLRTVAHRSAQPSPEVEAWRVRVQFDFAGGITGPVADLSGRLTLFERTMGGGALIQMPRGDEWAVHFPNLCGDNKPQDCPRAILESGPADFLNPGTNNFRWGASVQMLPNETSDGSNVLQKGLSMSGSQFKLQVDGSQGRPSCVLSSDEGKFVAFASESITDGRWHDLICDRTNSQLTLYVDGWPRAETIVPAGLSIVNEMPLTLGGKGQGPYNDQFHGTLDNAFVAIA
ncbi:MAG TPA: hypothetical protein DGG94_16325 [Micromonosporaceae bacterium]|nr:hypothetical protein [Micromonosporaceae bacterium]HCU51337.1 hypothetical protein [Micromonosporaceae bacterium]